MVRVEVANRNQLLGFVNGSGRSNTLFTMLKIAVLAPIPNASVSTAMTVKPGDFHKMRSP
jgi:hypothetical protein